MPAGEYCSIRAPNAHAAATTIATAIACTAKSVAAESKGWKKFNNVAAAAAEARPAIAAVSGGASE